MPDRPPKGRAVRNELEQFAAEHGTFWLIVLGVIVVKWAWSESKRSWRDWVRHISVALLVGYVLNSYLGDIPKETMGDGTKGVILALVVLQADHLLIGMMKLGRTFREDPASAMRALVDIWRGRK